MEKQFILLKNDSSCSQIMLYICLNRLNPETGKLGMSHSVFKKSDIRPLGKLILSVFSLLRLVQVEDGVGEDKKSMRVNNFTLINFVIKMLGPLHERTLTTIMLGIQVGFLRFTSKLLHWLYIIYLLFHVWMISCGVTILMRPPWQTFLCMVLHLTCSDFSKTTLEFCEFFFIGLY